MVFRVEPSVLLGYNMCAVSYFCSLCLSFPWVVYEN